MSEMKKYNYKEVTDYLDRTLVFGIKPGLERINKFIELSGHPEKNTDFIHIIGTNGKTSVTKITASLLKEHGIKTGYYVSPHINSYTERLAINGKELGKEVFSSIFSEVLPLVNKINSLNINGSMTQFEILTAMMFFMCQKMKLDVMVMEAGLGGRWDATNVVNNSIVGLTGISLEHTQLLGKTIGKIAAEKAAVIKNKCLIASNSTSPVVNNILMERATRTDSRLFIFKKNFKIIKIHTEGISGARLDLKGVYDNYRNIVIPLAGDYQKKNLLLSIVLTELYMHSLSSGIEQKKINEALKSTNISGRFQVIKKDPVFIADASHNPEGVKNFSKNIEKYFPGQKKIIIFAVLKDKNYKKMLQEIIKIADTLIISSSLNERSLPVNEARKTVSDIQASSKQKNLKTAEEILLIDNIKNSIKYALNLAEKDDIIALTGSITNLEFVKPAQY